MMTVSRMMLAAAATSLAIAPVAAEAGTRASAGSASSAAVSAPGQGRAAKGEKVGSQGSVILLALIAGGLAVAGLVSASQSPNKGQSPGT